MPFASNEVTTSKYTLITFLPLNLFEQLSRPANFYFVCIAILQARAPRVLAPRCALPHALCALAPLLRLGESEKNPAEPARGAWKSRGGRFMPCPQVVPQVSTTQGRPTILLPLCFVLIVSAIKDAVEDAKRRSAGRDACGHGGCGGPPLPAVLCS